LYIKVARYLQAHPTTDQSPFKLRIKGLPVPEKPLPPTPAPRGWKLGTVLPFHSPGVSGGGVSDNPFKDAMKEMQEMGGFPPMPGMPAIPPGMGMPDMGGSSAVSGESKKKKDKKKR
ncbi:signal recognition particle subunit, partial [Ascosphaera aggregata]